MKKILFEILIFVLIDIIIIFVVVNFKCRGNSPLNESELKRYIPILIAVTIVIGISSHFFNSNNQE